MCSPTSSASTQPTSTSACPCASASSRSPARTSRCTSGCPAERTLRGAHVVVGRVGVRRPLPVLEEAEGPVLCDPALLVLVPAVHVRPAPRHHAVLGVDPL